MSCAKAVRSILISDAAGCVIGSVIKEINDLTRGIKAFIDRFQVVHAALLACTTPTDLEAHCIEGMMHLKTAFEKLKKFDEFSKVLNVDAMFMLARHSKGFYRLGDEKLRAGVEKVIVEARMYIRNAV
jgi:hypothetical protein